jgi:hypothetical protein
MSFDKTEVYESEISPLLERIYDVCRKHKIPFTHTCTVVATGKATYVNKGVIGDMDPNKTDPYSRINLALADFNPEAAELVWLGLMRMMVVDTEAESIINDMMDKLEREMDLNIAMQVKTRNSKLN